jgi:hypothetical protein
MASVRKGTWRTRKGEKRTGWIVDFTDAAGKRDRRQLRWKAESDAFRIKIEGKLSAGTYRADASKITVKQVAERYIEHCWRRMERRERMTHRNYEVYVGHVRNYICPDPKRWAERRNAVHASNRSCGALEILGSLQATEEDNYRDAEPGKILHEMRYGELAHFKLIPHTPYFGTADATPLYLITLHAAWRATGDRALLERHLKTAAACLSSIDEYGDRDSDGFQEYQTRSPVG